MFQWNGSDCRTKTRKMLGKFWRHQWLSRLSSRQIEIKGRRYYDGAIGQWLPIVPLYTEGIRRVVAVSARPMVPVSDSAYPGCAITSIAPEKPLGRFPVATFRFTRQAIERWIEQGYSDALKALTNNPQLLKS